MIAWTMLALYGLHRYASSIKRADLLTAVRVAPDLYSIARKVLKLYASQ